MQSFHPAGHPVGGFGMDITSVGGGGPPPPKGGNVHVPFWQMLPPVHPHALPQQFAAAGQHVEPQHFSPGAQHFPPHTLRSAGQHPERELGSPWSTQVSPESQQPPPGWAKGS